MRALRASNPDSASFVILGFLRLPPVGMHPHGCAEPLKHRNARPVWSRRLEAAPSSNEDAASLTRNERKHAVHIIDLLFSIAMDLVTVDSYALNMATILFQ